MIVKLLGVYFDEVAGEFEVRTFGHPSAALERCHKILSYLITGQGTGMASSSSKPWHFTKITMTPPSKDARVDSEWTCIAKASYKK